MKETDPVLSVVIPTHNRPERLRRAVQSVLSQDFEHTYEIIIVDDGVEKRARTVVEEFDSKIIRYVAHESNRGGGAARNTGITHARGIYVAFLDDDDEWLVGKLQKQYEILEQDHIIGFVVCPIRLVYEDSGRISEQRFEKLGVQHCYEALLDHRVRTLTSSLMIRKDVLDAIGGFDEQFPSSQEWDMMIRISKTYTGYFMSDVCVEMNFLRGEHIGGNLERRIQGRAMLVRKYYKELKKRPRVLARHYFQLGLFCRDNKDFFSSRMYFFKAVATDCKFMYIKHLFSVCFGKCVYNIVRTCIKMRVNSSRVIE